MTFEETMKLWFPLGFEDWDGNLSEHHLKAAWNAAIEAAIDFLNQKEKTVYGEYAGQAAWYAALISDLKTN